ncbi:TetR/AcrR family transcriptional regulator [uncultured Actinomyces sp.]|uniref:TetR/AcrR family transcriptional regulator n=1 Tax=uncultured Actinomyces sp. TaxID=249061 RepID=UPI00261BA7A9|nr:TetR/AcrR family transcriptional regulator [uncultured Actinomyces sp.]
MKSLATGPQVSARRAAVYRLVGTTPSEKRAHTQELLLAAGRELVVDKGIGAVSVGDVCTRAGFTRGAFYSNFTDMDHFIHRLAENEWEAMTAFVDAAVSAGPQGGSGVDRTPRADADLRAGADPRALVDLAGRLMEVVPVSREFYFLQSEFMAYLVRDPERRSALGDGYEVFKRRLGTVLETELAAVGRECVLSVTDTTELFLADVERSMRLGLIHDDSTLAAYVDRTLAVILLRLSQPLRQ